MICDAVKCGLSSCAFLILFMNNSTILRRHLCACVYAFGRASEFSHRIFAFRFAIFFIIESSFRYINASIVFWLGASESIESFSEFCRFKTKLLLTEFICGLSFKHFPNMLQLNVNCFEYIGTFGQLKNNVIF